MSAIRAFDPLSIPNCKGWYQVDGGCDVSTDGSGIGTLYDRSGNGNHLTQATSGKKPLYKTARINGKATALHDGVDDTLRVALSQSLPATIFLVAKRASNTLANKYWFSGYSATELTLFNSVSQTQGQIGLYSFGGQITPTIGRYDEWNVISVNAAGTGTNAVYSDGVNLGSNGTSTGGTLTGISVASNFDTAGGYADLEVAELIIYSGTLSDQDRKTVEAYLAAKYAIGYKAPNDSSLVSNLYAWYDASQETGYSNGATLTGATDKSGNSRNMNVVTGTPTFQTGVINGRPVYRFASGQDLRRASFGLAGTQATVFVVHKSSTRPGMPLAYGLGAANGGGFLIIDNAATVHWQVFGTSATASSSANSSPWFDDGNWNIGSFMMNSGTPLSQFWKNGASDSTSATNFGNLATNTLYFAGGNPFAGGFSYVGDIAEVIIFSTALSDADRRAVENYLAQKYNIAV